MSALHSHVRWPLTRVIKLHINEINFLGWYTSRTTTHTKETDPNSLVFLLIFSLKVKRWICSIVNFCITYIWPKLGLLKTRLPSFFSCSIIHYTNIHTQHNIHNNYFAKQIIFPPNYYPQWSAIAFPRGSLFPFYLSCQLALISSDLCHIH